MNHLMLVMRIKEIGFFSTIACHLTTKLVGYRYVTLNIAFSSWLWPLTNTTDVAATDVAFFLDISFQATCILLIDFSVS
jgi:hypothetical protein